MSVESITLQLPESVVRQARQAARASRRTVEEVLAAWVRPPVPPIVAPELPEDLIQWPNEELLRLAQASLEPGAARRLEMLLETQRERPLTDVESAEALRLVEEEDRLTLRRARAWYVLKQRGIEPHETSAPSR